MKRRKTGAGWVATQQFVMATLVRQVAVIQYRDTVDMENYSQAMSDYQGGAAGGNLRLRSKKPTKPGDITLTVRNLF